MIDGPSLAGRAAPLVGGLMGAGGIVNGIAMLAVPWRWYAAVPGVTATGAFNQHFIRDIGMTFVLLGAAFLIGAARRRHRALLWFAGATWLTGHAVFHAWEVVSGICGPDAIARDFPAVTLPALIAIVLAIHAWRDVTPGARGSSWGGAHDAPEGDPA